MFIYFWLITNVILSVILANEVPILNVPNEILLKVAERLPFQDVYRFGRVHSRIHRKLIKDFDEYLRKMHPNEKDISRVLKVEGSTVLLKVNENILSQTEHMGFLWFNLIHSFEDYNLLLRFLSTSKEHPKIEVILDFEKFNSEDLFKRALKVLSEDNVNLISLKIARIPSKEVCLLIPPFVSKKKSLKLISITKSTVSCEVELIKSISKSQSEIIHLDLSNNNIPNFKSREFTKFLNNSKVESLDLSDNNITLSNLFDIFTNVAMFNLNHLNLSGIDRYGDNPLSWGLLMEMVRLSKLKSINLSCSKNIKLHGSLITYGFPDRLEHLDISNSGLDVKDVIVLIEKVSSLQSLNIKENYIKYNNRFFNALTESNLKTLRLTRNIYLDKSLRIFSQSIIESKLDLLEIEGDQNKSYKKLKESLKEHKPNLKIVFTAPKSSNDSGSDVDDFSLGLAILSLLWQRG
ncbi:hypothetical protein O9G_002352 [Rozella allomycis CSF55]|uniref:F-box domain-containing protein n=1 Tax=Rozella allomycis (strain CSF55) TaxID=988480 RepID=A0A075B4Y0_ROZAC|nr:hypothetical protein O9G_002352 [Rozella allomycis CSF55]|eukprot:EPZ36741.1 hypothetical protein O9G_002352 [Rozella allomycis CSF55]